MALRPFYASALLSAVFIASPTIVFAQTNIPQATAPKVEADIVLTPSRSPEAITRSGSAVTVIRAEEIEKYNPSSLADVLRNVPSVGVVENGGTGQSTFIRLRGAEARHTLVLIDGVRVNDPSSTGNEFDFAHLVPTDIERIEVLRGPQSALYGSDAIGGVINIITRKGKGEPRIVMSREFGSYGTTSSKASVSGGGANYSYALSVTGAKSSGFSTYGHRIGRIENATNYKLENDGYHRGGASARFSWRPIEGVELETGANMTRGNSQYDAAYGSQPDTPSRAKYEQGSAYVKANFDAFKGRLKNTVTLFGSLSNRDFKDISYLDFGWGEFRDWSNYKYHGERRGAEYQGTLGLDQFGKLIFGTRFEEERFAATTNPVDSPWTSFEKIKADQITRALFALYQLPIGERFDLSLGGRRDAIMGGDAFNTWRATASYRLLETGTKFRASIGTGAKAPSLFQRFSPQYGEKSLVSEKSLGIDAGIDQKLFNDRLTLSASVFQNKISSLIDFNFATNHYYNVGKAKTSGIEFSGDAELIKDRLRARASYTYLHAIDVTTGLTLARRPEHSGRFSLLYTPNEKLTLEPSMTIVGERFSSPNEKLRLAPYAKFDMRADYKINKTFSIFGRAENITNAKYQEVADYGTPGRSFFAGLKTTW